MAINNLLFFNKQGDQYNFEWNGTFWEGNVLFGKVSEKLFEIEHVFIIEKFLDSTSTIKYGLPHATNTPVCDCLECHGGKVKPAHRTLR